MQVLNWEHRVCQRSVEKPTDSHRKRRELEYSAHDACHLPLFDKLEEALPAGALIDLHVGKDRTLSVDVFLGKYEEEKEKPVWHYEYINNKQWVKTLLKDTANTLGYRIEVTPYECSYERSMYCCYPIISIRLYLP